MGMFTLTDFRDLLSTALGNRGIGNEKLDLWITLAYVEVMTSAGHAQLVQCAELNTVKNEPSYVLPPGILGIETILDHTNGRTLLRTGIDNLKNYSKDERGEPKLWARLGAGFELWPIPDAVYKIEAVYFKEAAKLVNGVDKSILPSTWDNAIYLLSVHYALSALGEDQAKTQEWFTRAIAYMRSRFTDDDYAAGSPSMPFTVARSFDDLTRHRTVM
jgi:hypothetical protein